MSVSELPLICKYIDKPGKLLEIGGKIDSKKYEPYYIRKYWIERGHDYYGIDKNDDLPGLNIYQCDIEEEKLPFSSHCFDYVILMQVLEHLGRNPIHALKEMYRVLRHNGILVITTPNFFNLTNIWSLIKKRKHHDFDSLINEHKLERFYTPHIRVYTKREVTELLKFIGFDIVGFHFMLRRDTMMFVCLKK
jgi:SAM-dependent methyltransferase